MMAKKKTISEIEPLPKEICQWMERTTNQWMLGVKELSGVIEDLKITILDKFGEIHEFLFKVDHKKKIIRYKNKANKKKYEESSEHVKKMVLSQIQRYVDGDHLPRIIKLINSIY